MAVRCRIGLHDEDKSEGTFMGTKMRIAQIAPLTEAVPPKLYGGTERVVSWLTEALVEQERDVTLFASGDSVTAVKLEPMWPREQVASSWQKGWRARVINRPGPGAGS